MIFTLRGLGQHWALLSSSSRYVRVPIFISISDGIWNCARRSCMQMYSKKRMINKTKMQIFVIHIVPKPHQISNSIMNNIYVTIFNPSPQKKNPNFAVVAGAYKILIIFLKILNLKTVKNVFK